MKKLLLIAFLITELHVYAQFPVPFGGGVSSVVTSCSGTMVDNGVFGNYSNNQDASLTIFPSTPGQYVTATFTAFNTEAGYDYLYVYDGPSGPLMATYNGTPATPFSITASSNNLTGALTFRFHSDGSQVRAGWSANISCTSSPSVPPAFTNSAQDCQNGGGTTICTDAAFNGNSAGAGSVDDLDDPWQGCLLTGEHQSSWYYFSPSSGGTVQFSINPQNASDDYDFAIWGPFNTLMCPKNITTAPLRCSYSQYSGSTGLLLGAGDNSENYLGDKWVNAINVNSGEIYIMVIDNWTASSDPFDFDWTLTSGASLDCTPLPIELLSFDGKAEDHYNYLSWSTAVEINNEYYTLEKSPDGVSWSEMTRIPGAGNSNQLLEYNAKDYMPYNDTYYRLKQTDYDGTSVYFDIIYVSRAHTDKKEKLFTCYPNPADEYIIIQTTNAETHYLSVIDETGKMVLSQTLTGITQHNVNLASLKAGLYTLLVQAGDEISYEKIIIR